MLRDRWHHPRTACPARDLADGGGEPKATSLVLALKPRLGGSWAPELLHRQPPAAHPAPAQAEVGCWLPLRVGALPDQGCSEQRPHLFPDDLVLLAAGPLDKPPPHNCVRCVSPLTHKFGTEAAWTLWASPQKGGLLSLLTPFWGHWGPLGNRLTKGQGGRDEMNVERAWVTLALETGGVYFTQTGREGHLGRVRCLALGSLPPPLPRASLASSVPL